MKRYIFNLFLLLSPPTRWFAFKRWLAISCGLDIENDVCINGNTHFYGSGKVSIGKGTWIGLRNSFYTTKYASILIGRGCDIGPDVAFIPGSHEIGFSNRRAGSGTGRDIVVEDGCWIGARVTILGGVTISKGAIIGAGALVNKDVPADCIYAGVPAVLIRTLIDE